MTANLAHPLAAEAPPPASGAWASAALEAGEDFEWAILTASDLDAVRAFHELVLPVRYDDTFYRDLLNGNTVALLLRERTSRQIVGLVTAATAVRSTWMGLAQTREAYIMTLGVLPKVRRRGVAQRLLVRLLTTLKEQHVDEATLHVITTNSAALALYRRLGFTVSHRVVNYYRIGGKPYDAWHLQLALRSWRPPGHEPGALLAQCHGAVMAWVSVLRHALWHQWRSLHTRLLGTEALPLQASERWV